jgi:methylenetetrahydrofolate dehydrogenase (NADP+)/methenyltetrahydrofolate cyclohydrolase
MNQQMLRLSGTEVAQIRAEKLRERIAIFEKLNGRPPGLAVIIVGEDPASQVYVRNKVKTSNTLGICSFHEQVSGAVTIAELRALIEGFNKDQRVDGILVQLPLPPHLNANEVLSAIDPSKDPDGLTVENMGLLFAGRRRVAPCTPAGIMAVFEHYGISVAGKHAVVVGRSNIVGKPMAQLLLEAQATVTICHSKTIDLEKHTQLADIVVVAAGKPRFLGADAFKSGVVVIDVGMHRQTGDEIKTKLCGDVRFEELDQVAAAATPVPGGVGPMTIQMLMENTVQLAEQRNQSKEIKAKN